MGKIKLSHEEIEVKTFLEILGVYAVLALVLVGIYYLEPVITGFATVESYDQSLELELLNSINDGEIWTVSFVTAGTGNLIISGIDGASYSELYNDNFHTINNLDILELKCGGYEIFNIDNLIETQEVGFILWNNSKARLSDLVWSSVPINGVYVENYNCDNRSGYFTVGMLTKGRYSQEFKFGNEIKIANMNFEKKI